MAEAPEGRNRNLLLAYAEASRDLALPLARALEAAAFNVSHSTSQHSADDAALDAAKTVLVCWTPAAIASDAVSRDAARARKAGKLASVLLAPCTPPSSLGGQYLLADLSGWRGDAGDREFVAFVHAIHARQSRRLFSSAPQWAARYLSWGSLGAVALGAVAVVANFGDVRQTIDGVFNPSASEAALNATDAKVEEVLTLLKQKSGKPLSADAEASLRESIERLLAAQSGVRGRAAEKLEAGDLAGAQDELRSAAQQGEQAVAGLAETWLDVGALAYLGDTDAAMSAYQRVLQLTPGNTVAMVQLGSLYLRTGRYDDADKVLMAMRLNAKDEIDRATAIGLIGDLQSARGDLTGSEKSLKEALALNRKIGNRQGEGEILNSLGELLRVKGDLTGAERNIRLALAIAKEEHDEAGEAVAHMRLGLILSRVHEEEALAAIEQARAFAESTGDLEMWAATLCHMADIEIGLGRIDQAASRLDLALQLTRRSGAREAEAYTLSLLGEISVLDERKSDAIEQYQAAWKIYRAIGITDQDKRMLRLLKEVGAKPTPNALPLDKPRP